MIANLKFYNVLFFLFKILACSLTTYRIRVYLSSKAIVFHPLKIYLLFFVFLLCVAYTYLHYLFYCHENWFKQFVEFCHRNSVDCSKTLVYVKRLHKNLVIGKCFKLGIFVFHALHKVFSANILQCWAFISHFVTHVLVKKMT